MMRVVTIVQARMGSSRFPGKVMRPLGGQPVLERVLQRVRQSHLHGEMVVATSYLEQDDPITEWCQQARIACFRGSERDVLERYYQCALLYRADVIVRVTADSPLLDPEILDAVIATQLQGEADYVCCRDLPAGIGQETFTFAALECAFESATRPQDREHVITYFTEHPALFRLCLLDPPAGLHLPDWRITLDTEQDYRLFCRLFALTDGEVMQMRTSEIVALIRQYADLLSIAQRRQVA
ncbi:MAG: glycosyltransferase family protein [Chloroherpetonaceae bacterium]|nr:glycosyltransferase family protein [Chthonomonadaceae bacterium]MDW8206712.1 glycosyltransferase family protein [Chloroherpetonaceae bacterium]